jgi:6-pyruvoyltetrahydropterin/6-carboxytetrahydropterin synthase
MLLTRRYRFVASHRLNAPSLSEEENRRLYGKCNNPHGHGHDYVLDVTIEGRPDDSGQLVQRESFDRMIQEQVLTKLDHENLNDIIPEVATTENLAKLVRGLLTASWSVRPRLMAVRISETDRNTFTLQV